MHRKLTNSYHFVCNTREYQETNEQIGSFHNSSRKHRNGIVYERVFLFSCAKVFCTNIRLIWGVHCSFCHLIIFMRLDCKVRNTIVPWIVILHIQMFVQLVKLHVMQDRRKVWTSVGTSRNRISFKYWNRVCFYFFGPFYFILTHF